MISPFQSSTGRLVSGNSATISSYVHRRFVLGREIVAVRCRSIRVAKETMEDGRRVGRHVHGRRANGVNLGGANDEVIDAVLERGQLVDAADFGIRAGPRQRVEIGITFSRRSRSEV